MTKTSGKPLSPADIVKTIMSYKFECSVGDCVASAVDKTDHCAEHQVGSMEAETDDDQVYIDQLGWLDTRQLATVINHLQAVQAALKIVVEES